MDDNDSDDDLLANLLSTAQDEKNEEQSKPTDQEVDSDEELLSTLLGTDNDNDSQQPNASSDEKKTDDSNNLTKSKSNTLKELDFNFLDVSDDVGVANETQSPSKRKKPLLVQNNNNDDDDSSDDESKKYFEQQKYTDYGKEIRNLMKIQNSEKNFRSDLKKENNFAGNFTDKSNSSLSKSWKTKVTSTSSSSDKYSLHAPIASNNVKKDVYCDPIFGLRIVNPMISSTELTEKMQGRKAVTISSIKQHLSNVQSTNSQEDWVVAGVLLNKSATKTSIKGSQYTIWKLSDLTAEMNTITVFLFSGAYKNLWKIPTSTIIALLNPSVLDNKENKDLATLSVDSERKVMLLGLSRDVGKCKSMKKNGQPCTAPVNLRHCEYCIYHVKQEYGKFSKRTDLQSNGLSNTLSNLGKNVQTKKPIGTFQQRHPLAQPFIAILGKKDEAQVKKDRERLAMLRGDTKALEKNFDQESNVKSCIGLKKISVELTSQQTKKDYERLNKLRGWSCNSNPMSSSSSQLEEKKTDTKLTISPRLGLGSKAGLIDFSEPILKTHVNKAKLNAIEYVKKFGSFKKINPNQIRPSKDVLNEKGAKRRREEEDVETVDEKTAKKKIVLKNRFQEMLEKKSSHTELIEKHQDEETEQYFRKQLAKERMEEKMLTTFKVPCKAVQCKICNYVAFSSSDLCKKLQHPIKIFDAVKRFFKCGDCGNRTITLDRIPTESCKRCSGSKWVKAAMMDEKRTQLPGSKLSIRGAEEAYIGATITGENLDLLVPEND